MIGEKDYRFRDDLIKDPKDTIPIEILTEPYKNIIIKFTSIKITEQESEDSAKISFGYEVIDSGSKSQVSLYNDTRFTQHLGILLNHLILESLEPSDAN